MMIKSIIIAIFITLGVAMCCSCACFSKEARLAKEKAKANGTFWSVQEEQYVPGTTVIEMK